MFGKQCAHSWEVKGKTRALPREAPLSFECSNAQVFREVTQGVTRFLLTCTLCGEITTREVLGVLVPSEDE